MMYNEAIFVLIIFYQILNIIYFDELEKKIDILLEEAKKK